MTNRPRTNARCLALWEASVRATHHFLRPADIDFYRPFVRRNLEALSKLLHYEGNRIVAFLAYDLQTSSIEMLFVHPRWQGLGIGTSLIQRAVTDYRLQYVDVNEQNAPALAFYLRCGFQIQSRTPVDGFGKPYPILHLRLTL